MSYDSYFSDKYDSFCECVIDGVRQPYDACSSGLLTDAISYYKNFDYIGSNDGIIYINGVLNDFKTKHYFFIYKSLKKIRLKKLSNDIL